MTEHEVREWAASHGMLLVTLRDAVVPSGFPLTANDRKARVENLYMGVDARVMGNELPSKPSFECIIAESRDPQNPRCMVDTKNVRPNSC